MFTRALFDVYSYDEEDVTENGVAYKKLSVVEGKYTPTCQIGLPTRGGVAIRGTFRTADGSALKREPHEVTRDHRGLKKMLRQVNAARLKEAKAAARLSGDEIAKMGVQ